MTDSFPIIETERLRLRQFSIGDLENVFRGLSHPDVIKYYGVSFKSLEAAKEQISWFAELEKSGTGLWWAICWKDKNTFVGAGGFNDLDNKKRKTEIGFWLLPDFWGKGIMNEAMPVICDYGFRELGLNRIEGFVEPDNDNVKKVLPKLNFRYEGTMVDCEVKDGKYISLEIYSKLNSQKL